METLSLWNEEQTRSVYYSYGVDLIRTGGLLLRTTPSVIYRASVLFHRFEQSVDAHHRAHYYSPAEMLAGLADTPGAAPVGQVASTPPPRPATDYMSRTSMSRSDTSRGEDMDKASNPGGDSHRAAPGRPCCRHVPDTHNPSVHKREYLVPDHIGSEMRSGLAPWPTSMPRWTTA